MGLAQTARDRQRATIGGRANPFQNDDPLGKAFADSVEKGAGDAVKGVMDWWERSSADQEGIGDDLLRLVAGGVKNTTKAWKDASAEQEGITDDILRGVGWTAGKGMQVLDAGSYYGGQIGGKLASAVGVDARIGGAAGNIIGDVLAGGAVAKAGQVAKTTSRLRRLRASNAMPFAIEAAATGKYSFAYGEKTTGLIDDVVTAAKTTSKQRKNLKALENQTNIRRLVGGDPLTSRARITPIEIGVGQKYKAKGVGLYDPDEASAVQKLIAKSLDEATSFAEDSRIAIYQEVFDKPPTGLTTAQVKKQLSKAGLSDKARGFREKTQQIKRGLNDMLMSDPKFMHEIGAIRQITDDPSLLSPEKIGDWAQALDTRISGSKKGVAFHHAVLSSPQDLLHPSNVSNEWREQFLKLVDDKFEGMGSASIVKQDIAAHKPFTPPKDIKGVTESNKWNAKGILGDALAEYTDLPASKTGIKVLKEIEDKGKYSKGLEGKLQKVIRTLENKATHAPWSHNNKGWNLDPRLGQFSPEDAYKVAEHVFDMERIGAQHGVELTTRLQNWKNRLDKGAWDIPPNMEKAINALQSNLDRLKVPDITEMEKLYEADLQALLRGGSEALEMNRRTGRYIPNPKKSLKDWKKTKEARDRLLITSGGKQLSSPVRLQNQLKISK